MRRFYRDLQAALLALATMPGPLSAAPQTAALPPQPLLGSTLNADLLQDLPTSNNPFSVRNHPAGDDRQSLLGRRPERRRCAEGRRLSQLVDPDPVPGWRHHGHRSTHGRHAAAAADPAVLGTTHDVDRGDGGRRPRSCGVDDAGTAAARDEVVPRGWWTVFRPGPGVGGDQRRAGGRSRAPPAGRKRPGQWPSYRSTGPRRRRIVARTVARARAGHERDERPRGVRTGASGVCGDPSGRSPRAWLGTAGHDVRRHGYRTACAVDLGAARSGAADVASLRRVHTAHPNRTDGVDIGRGQPSDRSGVRRVRCRRRHRPPLGGRRARGAPGDGVSSHDRRRSRRRSSARRANGDRADPRTGRRSARTCVDDPPRRSARTIDISRHWRCMPTSI